MIFNLGESGNSYTEVEGVLSAGETSITLSHDVITTDSTIDPYTSIYGVNPTDITLSNGAVVLEFDEQETDINVKVRVS